MEAEVSPLPRVVRRSPNDSIHCVSRDTAWAACAKPTSREAHRQFAWPLARLAHRAIDRIALVVAFLMFVGGCASVSPTTPTTVRISAQRAQAEFGTLGVATVERAPQVIIGEGPVPSTRGEGAGMGALAGAIGPPLMGGAYGGPWGVALGILVSPLTTIVGAIYGALSASPPEEIERATHTLEAAGQAAAGTAQYQLRDLVIAELRREGFGAVIPIGAGDSAPPAVDTLVEVEISDIRLVSEDGTLTLDLWGGMRLHGPGVLVEALPMHRRGRGHTLPKWAADGAKTFKEQITHESVELAKEVVSALLSRPIPNLRLPVAPPPAEDTAPPESNVKRRTYFVASSTSPAFRPDTVDPRGPKGK